MRSGLKFVGTCFYLFHLLKVELIGVYPSEKRSGKLEGKTDTSVVLKVSCGKAVRTMMLNNGILCGYSLSFCYKKKCLSTV